jgi:hypothetical protein
MGNLTAPMLDDQELIAPRTTYDLFLRRDRAVMYVNGQQRICNDFGPVALTMAEGALGFGQVLYHTAIERMEILSPDNWDRSGQRYIVEDTPYIDHRTWDNVAYGEHVALPSGGVSTFDESMCFAYSP